MSGFSGQFKFQTPSGFVVKLRNLVDDPENVEVITWSKSGTEIVIQDIDKFKDYLVKSSVFKTNNFSSFVRQLNMYGFHKVNGYKHSYGTKHPLVFEHPNFQRDKPHLLSSIKRFQKSKDRIDLPSDMQPGSGEGSPSGSFLTLNGPHGNGSREGWSPGHSPSNSVGSAGGMQFPAHPRMEQGHLRAASHAAHNMYTGDRGHGWNPEQQHQYEQEQAQRQQYEMQMREHYLHGRPSLRRDRPVSMPVSADEYNHYYQQRQTDGGSPHHQQHGMQHEGRPQQPPPHIQTHGPPSRSPQPPQFHPQQQHHPQQQGMHRHQPPPGASPQHHPIPYPQQPAPQARPPHNPHSHHHHTQSFGGWQAQHPNSSRHHRSLSSNMSADSSSRTTTPMAGGNEAMEGVQSNTKTIVDESGKSHSVWRAF